MPAQFHRRLQDSIDHRVEARRWSKRSGRVLDAVGVGVASTVFVDVFDTVLTRRTLGSEPATTVVARTHGPLYLRHRTAAGQRFEHIEDICAAVSRALGGIPSAEELIAAEVAAELELCARIPGAVEWLTSLRAAGKNVVFVSDMHLSTEVIGVLLRSHGLLQPEDELVVSSDWGVTKRSGELLGKIMEKLSLQAEGVVHVGNDVITDGVMPRRAGLAVNPAQIGNLSRFEQIAADLSQETQNLSSVIGGAAKQARLHLQTRREASAESALIEIGSGVGGILGVSFLIWLLTRVRSAGTTTLYFVARDGEILLRMAQALPEEYTDGIELRYLHANRRSIGLAYAHLQGVESWIERGTASVTGRLVEGSDRVPFRNLCERVGLEPIAIRECIPDAGDLNPDHPLPVEHLDGFISALKSQPILEQIRVQAERRHSLVAEYFAQEGLGDGAAALVDVGWTGQLAEAIANVARPHHSDSLPSYHFGSTPSTPRPDAVVEAFLDESSAGVDGLVVCVETFTASGAAPVTGFERSAEGIRPVFATAGSGENSARVYLHEAMTETARMMPAPDVLRRWAGTDGDSASVAALLRALWQRPTNAEAAALPPVLFESDDAGRVISGLTEPLRLSRPGGRRVWGEGSIAVSSLPVRLVAFTRRELRRIG